MARYEQAIEVYYGQILSRYFLEYDIIVGPYLMKLLQLWNINVQGKQLPYPLFKKTNKIHLLKYYIYIYVCGYTWSEISYRISNMEYI